MSRSEGASPASAFATELLAAFVRAGVRELVLSPGSRSQALALAAARLEQAGLLRVHVRIDERVGSFLALGLARETGVPVLVVTTSGTAVAELHPAVLEASHAGVPLVVLTADRPAELHGIGANQTTIQTDVFGVAARLIDVPVPAEGADHAAHAARLVGDALTGIDGPVQLNLAFRDPLSGPLALPDVAPGEWAPTPHNGGRIVLDRAPGTVVVAGIGAGEVAESAARSLDAPLLAEVVSGAHFGPNLVPAYRELLVAEGFGEQVKRVIVFGRPTLSREIPALVEREDVETILIRSPGRDDWNPGRRVARVADDLEIVDKDPESYRAWVGRWVAASRQLLDTAESPAANLSEDYRERARYARDQLARLREPVTRRMLVEAVWAATWPHDRLVVGASRLIRELDRVAVGKKLIVHANRGLAGIDGTIATATGVGLASQTPGASGEGGITRVLLGDLAVQHDLGSLLAAHGEEPPRLQLVVGNDGGGTMFDLLEVAGTVEAELFDRVLYTPNSLDLAALAAATGWEYRRVETRAELDPALTPSLGRVLVEVVLAR